MAGASAPFKAFLDSTSTRYGDQRWRDKLAAGFTNSAGLNGDKLATLQQFGRAHGMIWVGLGLAPGNHTSEGSADDLNRLAASSSARWLNQMPIKAPSWFRPLPTGSPPSISDAVSPSSPAACAPLAPLRRGHPMTATVEGILQEYFDGLYHGDTDRLSRVFHPQAIYASATGGELVYLTIDEYFPIVDARPSPASHREIRCTESCRSNRSAPSPRRPRRVLDRTEALRRRSDVGPHRRSMADHRQGLPLRARRGVLMPYVHIEITDEDVTDDAKAEVIAGVTDVLQRVLGKDPATTFVVIDEVPLANWGIGGAVKVAEPVAWLIYPRGQRADGRRRRRRPGRRRLGSGRLGFIGGGYGDAADRPPARHRR